ncbi:phosphohistidine phosphatase SixA [Psychrobacter raelei]|uniref:phosphohistidine phosphatase SixA n=1 Tax=Psychrobacter raelei TaxID=2565531 RepID=UPI003F5E1D7B
MQVIFMRHGEAQNYNDNDAERQLTQLGQQQAAETAQHLLSQYQPDAFVVSPYVRAQQTLEALRQFAPEIPVIVQPNITPSDDPLQALHSLMDVDGECVVVVCHMPIVAKMAAQLTADEPEPFSLAEARIFETVFIAPNMGHEIGRYVPKQY